MLMNVLVKIQITNFVSKSCIIISQIKVKTYIFKINFPLMNYLSR